mmetsp:Transcript_19684/g.58378  ORF Transcript_19684/g.58378 Transcript_19684/m.58378 type:complete len:100 (-) Transcript_19684:209-508(-)
MHSSLQSKQGRPLGMVLELHARVRAGVLPGQLRRRRPAHTKVHECMHVCDPSRGDAAPRAARLVGRLYAHTPESGATSRCAGLMNSRERCACACALVGG